MPKKATLYIDKVKTKRYNRIVLILSRMFSMCDMSKGLNGISFLNYIDGDCLTERDGEKREIHF